MLREARLRRTLRDALGYAGFAAANRTRDAARAAVAAESAGAHFTPDQASLLSRSPLPLATCGGCIFYRPDADGLAVGSCGIVQGGIGPEQVCSFFTLRSSYPAWARIIRATMQFGRGLPEKGAPVHRAVLEATRDVTDPATRLDLVALAQNPLLHSFLYEMVREE